VRIRNESLGGFSVAAEKGLPVEIGDNGLLETSKGCYQVCVVRKVDEDDGECLGLTRVKEVFADEVAALLDPLAIRPAPRVRPPRHSPPFLGMALLASVGAGLILFAVISAMDAMGPGVARRDYAAPRYVERNVAKRAARRAPAERGAVHLAKSVKSIKLPDLPSLPNLSGKPTAKAAASSASSEFAKETEAALARFDRSMVHLLQSHTGLHVPRMDEVLQLGEDQKREIHTVFNASLEALQEFYARHTEQPDDATRQRLDDLAEATRKQVMEILTPSQRERWEAHVAGQQGTAKPTTDSAAKTD
jgi:hypothetical protein